MKVKPAKIRGSAVEQSTDGDGAPLPKTMVAALKFKHILVPIEFSDSFKKSLQYAISLAQQFGARITFLHVLPVHYVQGMELESLDFGRAVEEDLHEKARQRLTEIAQTTRDAGVFTQIEVRRGSPSYEIINLAKEDSVDLIILPTHGHTSRVHALIGTPSSIVTRLTPCPVLVVPEQEAPIITSNPFKPAQPLAVPPASGASGPE